MKTAKFKSDPPAGLNDGKARILKEPIANIRVRPNIAKSEIETTAKAE